MVIQLPHRKQKSFRIKSLVRSRANELQQFGQVVTADKIADDAWHLSCVGQFKLRFVAERRPPERSYI